MAHRLERPRPKSNTSPRQRPRIELALEITNPADEPPVQIEIIDDPRLARATLVGVRDGATIGAPLGDPMMAFSIMGGSHWEQVLPGCAVRQTVWVDRALALSRPGHYRITATVELELAPEHADTSALDQQHRRWTKEIRASVEIDVR